jgi:hypothetical protein
MLSVYWLTSNHCEVEIGFDGKKCRILLVADVESSALEEEEALIQEEVKPYHVICLCGGILPATNVLKANHNSRILASEPIARLFSLSELESSTGSFNIERCQIQERIEIEEFVIVSPYYSGGTLGNSDWLVFIKGKPFLLFCGSKSKGCTYSPPPCKHVILAREPNDSNIVTNISETELQSSPYVVVPLRDRSAIHYLIKLWSISTENACDCLPYWCHEAKQLCAKYEPVWGKVQLAPANNIQQSSVRQQQIIYVFESELSLIKSIIPKNCVIVSNYLQDRPEFSWDVSDFSKIVQKFRGSGAIILGPRWLTHATSLPKPHRMVYKMDVKETFILEGEGVADNIYAGLNNGLASDKSVTINMHGLTMNVLSQGTVKALIEILGITHYKLAGEDGQLVHQIAQVLHSLTINEKKTSVTKGVNTMIKQRQLLALPQKRIQSAILEVEVDHKRAKVENIELTPAHVSALSVAPSSKMITTDVKQLPQILPDSVAQGINIPTKPSVDQTVQNLVNALKKVGGKLTLSDVAKLGEFGEKAQVMEFVRKYPGVFRVQIIDGKRIIQLV